MDGRLKSGEAHHRGEHHVDRRCFHHFVERLLTRVNFDIGTVGKQIFQRIVVSLIGYNHCGGIELMGLLGQFLHTVVSRKAVSLITVGVLTNDIKGLGTDGTGATQDAYLLFLHV